MAQFTILAFALALATLGPTIVDNPEPFSS